MEIRQAVTVHLDEQEARDYWAEVAELDGLLFAIDGGNTRTGMATIRKIRDELGRRGLGLR